MLIHPTQKFEKICNWPDNKYVQTETKETNGYRFRLSQRCEIKFCYGVYAAESLVTF